jgi:hypothetical protein
MFANGAQIVVADQFATKAIVYSVNGRCRTEAATVGRAMAQYRRDYAREIVWCDHVDLRENDEPILRHFGFAFPTPDADIGPAPRLTVEELAGAGVSPGTMLAWFGFEFVSRYVGRLEYDDDEEPDGMWHLVTDGGRPNMIVSASTLMLAVTGGFEYTRSAWEVLRMSDEVLTVGEVIRHNRAYRQKATDLLGRGKRIDRIRLYNAGVGGPVYRLREYLPASGSQQYDQYRLVPQVGVAQGHISVTSVRSSRFGYDDGTGEEILLDDLQVAQCYTEFDTTEGGSTVTAVCGKPLWMVAHV